MTEPNGKEFIGEYDLMLVDGMEPPILVRADTVPFIYMRAVHLEILETGWNWVMTMQHGLDPGAATHVRTDFGTWRIQGRELLLAEQGFPDVMHARFAADGRLILSACSGGLFGSCTEWVFERAPNVSLAHAKYSVAPSDRART